MCGCLEGQLSIKISPVKTGHTVSSRQTPHKNQIGLRSHCLNKDIVDSKDDCEDNEKPRNVGIISSQRHQYSKKAEEC